MNKNDRKKVGEWIETLSGIKSEIEDMQQDQQEKHDNMPEGLQDTERGEALEEAANELEEAASNIDSAIDNLQNISE